MASKINQLEGVGYLISVEVSIKAKRDEKNFN